MNTLPDHPTVDDPDDEPLQATDLRYVGPATAAVFEAHEYEPTVLLEKTISYDMLLEIGVNPGVAGKLRREYSLSWSFESADKDSLKRRSTRVRGLQDDERAWIAASTGDWERNAEDVAASTDGSGSATAAEAAWRERSKPTAVTEIEGLVDADADVLANAGIRSVRSLATADPGHVAALLGLDEDDVTTWVDAADEMTK